MHRQEHQDLLQSGVRFSRIQDPYEVLDQLSALQEHESYLKYEHQELHLQLTYQLESIDVRHQVTL